MKNILIVRHAESLANAGERTNAHDTIPLSEKGKIQAQELVKKLEVIPDLIVVSPYTRTYETALPFITKHQTVPVETWNVQEFTYLDPKIYNGTTMEERTVAVKRYWDLGDVHYRDSKETETFYLLIQRIESFINKLTTRPEKTIVIFSHGGFMQNLITYLDVINESHNKEELREEDVMELMNRYKSILGTKFPIENTSIHKLNI